MPKDDNIDTTSSDVSLDAADDIALPMPDAADSSSATGETSPEETSIARSVVEDVLKDDKEASPAPEESLETTDEAEPDAAEAEDDYSNVPFNAHPRFKALVTQKNRYKSEIEVLKPDAERYRTVQAYIDAQGMDAEEAAELLEIGGLIKNNPVEALKRARPTIEKLLIAAGEILPQDLKQKVAEGVLTREAAQEVSRARAALQSVQHSQQFQTQRGEQQREAERTGAIQSAVAEWEADRAKRDPNFAKKAPILMEKMQAAFFRGERPKDRAEAVAMLDRVYKDVNKLVPVAAAVPKTASRPVTGGQVAGTPQPKASSTLDVVEQVLAKHRSA